MAIPESEKEEPPTYQQASKDSRPTLIDLGPTLSGPTIPVIVCLIQNKPCKSVWIDPRQNIPWDDSHITKVVHEVLLLPPDYTLEHLYAGVRERIEQRFLLEVPYEELHVLFRVKMGRHGKDWAPRITVHEANYEGARALLEKPDAMLQALFGEVDKAAGKKKVK